MSKYELAIILLVLTNSTPVLAKANTILRKFHAGCIHRKYLTSVMICGLHRDDSNDAQRDKEEHDKLYDSGIDTATVLTPEDPQTL